jgi:hypothetical protein
MDELWGGMPTHSTRSDKRGRSGLPIESGGVLAGESETQNPRGEPRVRIKPKRFGL